MDYKVGDYLIGTEGYGLHKIVEIKPDKCIGGTNFKLLCIHIKTETVFYDTNIEQIRKIYTKISRGEALLRLL